MASLGARNSWLAKIACAFLLLGFSLSLHAAAQQAAKPRPTYANLSYGPHERNVLDLWLAKSDKPTPLVLFIHGGGFRGGSKSAIGGATIKRFLDAGISVAAIEYRFISDKPLPAAHYDCRRALQFLRYNAERFNIDKEKIGAFGGSAGAQLCMWLAFHDDMADPNSDDPIARESTRLTCVATTGGQTTMDFEWWKKWIPGIEDEASRRSTTEVLTELFGTDDLETVRKIVEDISALSLISKDDPPIFMEYRQRPTDPVPKDPQKARGWKIHHVIFGIKLKEKMDELGIEAVLKYPGVQTPYESREDFLIKKLSAK